MDPQRRRAEGETEDYRLPDDAAAGELGGITESLSRIRTVAPSGFVGCCNSRGYVCPRTEDVPVPPSQAS